ncbi:histidine phosphatase family protein [Tianweitania sediminis]|uniref:Histidine phosphatase family protein n=1 Tax=Tianweitania sediminis TaxID=1502156 RepID=A0A8J7R1B8_9HYPH|nr:histidine phosphatase family protein [Tianweitania sediminis]HEV7414876.1 histidine phosphatase family protein [Tianweitania sediminis]
MTRPLCYIVRHGQTDWNAEHRLQGQADRDINETGRSQATNNGLRLKDLVSDPATFDFVASPMLRTRHTMERVRTAMGLDPRGYRTDPRLMELNFGDWQGFTFAELEQRTPGLRAARNRDKWNYVPPGDGAESYAMLTQRIASWLPEIAQPTICVAHGGVIRALFRLLDAADEEEASRMDVPQDRILRMEAGRLEWL